MPKTKTVAKKGAPKAPAKKSIFKKLFKSQKGLINQRKFSRSEVFITIGVLATIGIVGVVVSHASTSAVPKGSAYGCNSTSTLHQGSSGACVSYLQALLKYHGKLSTAPDGSFGPKTATAVRSFQTSKGVTADAIVGPTTWGLLTGTKVASSSSSSSSSSSANSSGPLFSGQITVSRQYYSYGSYKGHTTHSYRYTIHPAHAKYGVTDGFFAMRAIGDSDVKWYASPTIQAEIKSDPSMRYKTGFEFIDYETAYKYMVIYEVDKKLNIMQPPLLVKNPYYKG